ncbi:uncharacterized protein LOC131618685 [Vicia villosa]|uniref:uncharacterized protein LOC131618685 n=1 Tax=Vicia villosa TaxID=3911 RepID=UPI00273A880E|nr:uncharacterized protein LOC131618685 [Vicia villosa]
MIYGLRNNRNNVIWNNEREEGTKLGVQAYYNWHDWYMVQEETNGEHGQIPQATWTPPSVGKVKCNVNAGFHNHLGTTNRGWCVRDHFGRFIVAGMAWNIGILSVIEAESMALKEVIRAAICMQLDNVIFESDFQRVIHVIHSNFYGSFGFSLIILAIKSLLLCSPNFEVKFIKRQVNSVVHLLAKATNS